MSDYKEKILAEIKVADTGFNRPIYLVCEDGNKVGKEHPSFWVDIKSEISSLEEVDSLSGKQSLKRFAETHGTSEKRPVVGISVRYDQIVPLIKSLYHIVNLMDINIGDDPLFSRKHNGDAEYKLYFDPIVQKVQPSPDMRDV